MNEHKSKELISNLPEELLDELLVFAPTFSEASLANIEARYFEKISSIQRDIVPSVSVTKGRKFSIKKIALKLAAAAMLLIIPTAVLAAVLDYDIGGMFNSFFRNPDATNVMEVGITVEADDIEITVLHAYTDGLMVYAMLEMRDLRQNRLSEDTSLIFHRDTWAHLATPVDFDEASGSAVMGISINRQFMPVEVGVHLRFALESVLIGADWFVEHVPLELPINLYVTREEMITQEEWINEAIARGLMTDGGINGDPGQFLKLGDSYEIIPGIDWAVLTNIGMYGNWLHIQTRRTDAWDRDTNRGFFSLVDKNGEVLQGSYSVFYGGYREDVFYIYDMDNLAGLSLAISYIAVEKVIHGPWFFSFPITARAERKFFAVELQDSLYLRRVSMQISPMNTIITFFPKDLEVFAYFEPMGRMIDYIESYGESFITLAGGSTITLYPNYRIFASNYFSFSFNSFYFDISQLHSITVLGVEHLLYSE